MKFSYAVAFPVRGIQFTAANDILALISFSGRG